MFIKTITSNEDVIYLNRKAIWKHRIPSRYMIFKFGQWQRPIRIQLSYQMDADTIGLSSKLASAISMPSKIPYELKVTNKTLQIGPVIAICVCKFNSSLSYSRMAGELPRFTKYKEIQGVMFLFAAEGVNTNKKTIDGYYYAPNQNDLEKKFVKSSIPYPDAVYIRAKMDERVINDIKSEIGDKLFNDFNYDKLQLWNWVKNNEHLKQLFPYTEQVKSPEHVIKILDDFRAVYLKPTAGSKAKGIIYVAKKEGQYLVKEHQKTKFKKYRKQGLLKYLQKISGKTYLVQQSIEVAHGNRRVDIRVYMQRNKQGAWESPGFIVRFAKKGKITTNPTATNIDQVHKGINPLMQVYGITEIEARSLERKMFTTCKELCEYVDKQRGHYADVAIDLIVDYNLDIWFLEVNKRLLTNTLMLLDDKKELFYKVKSKPIEYAKAIAGF
ncbi:YheC/YheD family protein [Desulfuribacillus alkaliarsenatis]|uniref:ATP-grasp domain-containing protein n=1 Tax=Desulfuribacillus alkaliarsenatis TaxID=766136 RepID=A0A1E5G3B5_9FIRM|nr:YheC/YheD family protein [Desulfuribacillus alkaliarsenatis]OEF97460.1 hypothetical protein BHF68_04440 [Desulfuribacillus alkaliarsenatis]